MGCAGYTGPEMTAPSMEDMNKAIVEHVIKATLKEIIEERSGSADSLRRPHALAHQSIRKVHYWWPSG